jgi:hypothetical protein
MARDAQISLHISYFVMPTCKLFAAWSRVVILVTISILIDLFSK